MRNRSILWQFPLLTHALFSLCALPFSGFESASFLSDQLAILLLASLPTLLFALVCVRKRLHQRNLLQILVFAGGIAFFYDLILLQLYLSFLPDAEPISLWEQTFAVFAYALMFALPSAVYAMLVLRLLLPKAPLSLLLNAELLAAVEQIAHQAGERLKGFYAQSLKVERKADDTPVTEADLAISQFVIAELQKLTPNVPILSEEHCDIPLETRANWQRYWLIDPLDGTQQFIDRTDQFSVVIALVQHNRPVLGVIHAPMLNKTYSAMAQHGAFLQENGEKRPLVAQPFTGNSGENSSKNGGKTHRLRITIGTSNSEKIRQMVRSPYTVDFLQYGSSSLKAGLVAEGKADCYIRLGDTGEWDTAAAEILLAEVGGQIFDLRFQPLSYNQRRHFINPHFIQVGDREIDWQAIFSPNTIQNHANN